MMTDVLSDDLPWMQHALTLARRGYYTARPNPRVGCVLVKAGVSIGEGYHQRAGAAHAEINALRQAGAQAAGATAYVTLEPCSHHGRTGPCADALIAAGITRLVVAMTDPNPLVAGRGLERCRQAGIEVVLGVAQSQAQQLNAGFVQRMQTQRPRVTLKLAMSLDGRTAMADGTSQWITGPAARGEVQRLRAASDAIITGSGSVLADDSRLTVRADTFAHDVDYDPPWGNPLRIVMDTRLRMPVEAQMLKEPGETIIVTASTCRQRLQALTQQGATLWSVPINDTCVDPAVVLTRLAAERQCNEVLIEAGPTLAGSWWQAGWVDRLILFIAPTLLGSDARPLMHLPLQHMAEKYALHIEGIQPIGSDWMVTASPAGRGNQEP